MGFTNARFVTIVISLHVFFSPSVAKKCKCEQALAKQLTQMEQRLAEQLTRLELTLTGPLDERPSECDAGWEKFGDSCYLFSEINRSWEASKTYCESVGASLVKVETDGEHQFLRDFMSHTIREYFWIGARYDATFGEHRWIDGSAMAFDGWAPGRPGSVHGCVDYLDNIEWLWNSHGDCKNTNGPSVCEKGL